MHIPFAINLNNGMNRMMISELLKAYFTLWFDDLQIVDADDNV